VLLDKKKCLLKKELGQKEPKEKMPQAELSQGNCPDNPEKMILADRLCD
jgi:hypothetical protein